MGTTYERADDELQSLIVKTMEQWHPELTNTGVTIGCLMAHAPLDKTGEPKGPALKHNGYAAAAIVRVNNLKLRSYGLSDAEILVDGDRWAGWAPERQTAIIDHELEHLIVRLDDGGKPKLDALGRPMLELKLHDWQLGGFINVAKRHGAASIEVTTIAMVIKTGRQLELPFEEMGVIEESLEAIL